MIHPLENYIGIDCVEALQTTADSAYCLHSHYNVLARKAGDGVGGHRTLLLLWELGGVESLLRKVAAPSKSSPLLPLQNQCPSKGQLEES